MALKTIEIDGAYSGGEWAVNVVEFWRFDSCL